MAAARHRAAPGLSDHEGDSPKAASHAGTLYVVATPIGNLEDITLRALRILKEVDLIACEDTRHTKKLLSHFAISTPQTSYYREKEVSKTETILQALQAGRNVALVSDAGVPCISDPGFVLVNEAHVAGIPVVAIPGPSALTTALSLAGLKAKHFLFLGFLPAKGAERRRLLQTMKGNDSLLAFYESPHRLRSTLADCLTVLGDRPAALCKELTKIHEQCRRGTLAALVAGLGTDEVRGEFVVLVEGATGQEMPVGIDDLDSLLAWYKTESGLSLKDAVAKVAADLGQPRAKVYSAALTVWGK